MDFRQADATVVRAVLDRHRLLPAAEWPPDIYDHFAQLTGSSRDETKTDVNKLLYVRRSATYLHRLLAGNDSDRFAGHLADALEALKATLWQEGKPHGKRPARVKTLGDTLIEGRACDRKRGIHPGTLLSWMIQGSVADVLNRAMLKLIERETTEGWRVLLPLHDAVLMLCPENKVEDVQRVMEDTAQLLGIPLKTKVAR